MRKHIIKEKFKFSCVRSSHDLCARTHAQNLEGTLPARRRYQDNKTFRCPATESLPRSLPPETLFRYRFSPWWIFFSIESPPGDYILNQSIRGRENVSSPVEINSPPGECLFRHELGYSHIIFIANHLTLFWLAHVYLNYELFSS